ncbi:MAG: hypothetical protein QM817_09700 [Archangium sp.]
MHAPLLELILACPPSSRARMIDEFEPPLSAQVGLVLSGEPEVLLFDRLRELVPVLTPWCAGFAFVSLLAFAIVSVSGAASRRERLLCAGVALAFGGAALAAPFANARVIGVLLVGLGSLGVFRREFIPDDDEA